MRYRQHFPARNHTCFWTPGIRASLGRGSKPQEQTRVHLKMDTLRRRRRPRKCPTRPTPPTPVRTWLLNRPIWQMNSWDSWRLFNRLSGQDGQSTWRPREDFITATTTTRRGNWKMFLLQWSCLRFRSLRLIKGRKWKVSCKNGLIKNIIHWNVF